MRVVMRGLAGIQVISSGCPCCGFLKVTSRALIGGSSGMPAPAPLGVAAFAAWIASTAALHSGVVYAMNSRLPSGMYLNSLSVVAPSSSKTPFSAILPRKAQNGDGKFQS
jgi:hypothetical protein